MNQETHRSTPLISTCMIVKNEAETLERCLKSIRPYVDDIIIVDTGSTDRTVEIAAKYTDRIYHHPWKNDFSSARNLSISYAGGEWIFTIDADEELHPGHGQWFRTSLPAISPAVDHLLVTIRNLNGEGGILSEFTNTRLFRNGRGTYFEGIVHNQVVARGEPGFAPVTLLHYGYALAPDKMDNKFKRTLNLTLKQIEAEPENPYYYHNLCLSLVDHGDYTDAVNIGNKALELMKQKFSDPYPPIYFNLIYLTGKAALASGNPGTAISVCGEALKQARCPIDILWVLTMANYHKGDYARAAAFGEDYGRAIAGYPDNAPPGMPVNTLGQTAPLLATAGYSAAHSGRHDRALYFFLHALEQVHWDRDFLIKILEFCKAHENMETGRTLLERIDRNEQSHPELMPFINTFQPQPPMESGAAGSPASQSSLILDFESDPLVSPQLGRLGLAEIRHRLEEASKPLTRERSLLMVLETLERETRGDRSW